MRRANLLVLLSVLPLATVTACYSYTPVQSPQPGMDVRTRLKADAAARRSQGLDEPVLRYDGLIVASTAESLSLDVLVARSSSAFQDIVIRDTLRIELSEIQSISKREFSPARTGLFTVGTAVAAFAVVKGIEQIVGGSEDPLDPGDPNFRSGILVPVHKLIAWLGAFR